MIEGAVDVTYRTMLRRCEGLGNWAKAHGYDRDLPLHKDWHVSFHRSTFKGEWCFFLVWSAIEFIWTPNGSGDFTTSYGVIE